MARGRRKRRSRKRVMYAYFLRTLFLAILLGLLVGAFFLIKSLLGNFSIGKKNEYTENTIEISKKGDIKGNIYEEFSQSYYDENELSKMIDSEIEDYNKLVGDNDAVKLNDFSVDEGAAKVSIHYSNDSEYRGFNGTTLYIGKVSELMENGVVFDQNLIDVDDSTSFISSTDISKIEDYNAVVTDEDVMLVCPSKILYYTSNVDLQDKNSGRAKGASSTAVLIYK